MFLSAGMSKFGDFMGGSDFPGATSAAENQERGRLEAVRTRPPCPSRRLQTVLVRTQNAEVPGLVQPHRENRTRSG